MTKKTDASLMSLLQKTVTELFVSYEHLKSRSEYWILFDRKSRDTYGLSFWPRASVSEQPRKKVEVPLVDDVDFIWLDCIDGVLQDLPVRIFESHPHPYATFNLTFQAVTDRRQPALIAVRPGSFVDALKTLVKNEDDSRSTQPRPCVGVP